MAPSHIQPVIQANQARMTMFSSLSTRSDPLPRHVSRSQADTRPQTHHLNLPRISQGRHTSLSGVSVGLKTRQSALRSLSNNPKLQLTVANGQPTLSKCKSLPHRLDSSQQTQILPPSQRGKIVQLTREGYHPRSNSPTYKTLIRAKTQLDIVLCKRILDLRRELNGSRARQNSAAVTIASGMSDKEEDYYDALVMGDDEDSHIIDRTRKANESPCETYETIPLNAPLPHRTCRFSTEYIREHVNDDTLLNLNLDEEERKLAEWKEAKRKQTQKASVSKNHVTWERQCMTRNSTSLFERKTNHPRRGRTQQIILPPTKHSVEHVVSKLKEYAKPRETPIRVEQKQNIQKARPVKAITTKKTINDENNNSGNVMVAIEPIYVGPTEPIAENSVAGNVQPDEIVEALPVSTPPKFNFENHPLLKRRGAPIIEHTPLAQVAEEEKIEWEPQKEEPETLTPKEKFLRLQKKMTDRKTERQKKRENFAEYSMIAFSRSKDGRREKSNMLGQTLSKRLEKITTFKSRKYSIDTDDDTNDLSGFDTSDDSDDD